MGELQNIMKLWWKVHKFMFSIQYALFYLLLVFIQRGIMMSFEISRVYVINRLQSQINLNTSSSYSLL